MFAHWFLKSVFLTAVVLVIQAGLAIAAHRQVFLLGGQSNMEGGGSINLPVSHPYLEPLPDVQFFYGNPGIFSTLAPDEWIDLAPGSGNLFGPELTFGHTLHQRDPQSDYALIKYARGGSNVSSDWNPTVENNVYANFQATADAALQKLTEMGDTYEIVGMLWTQGIRDGKDGSNASDFQTNLERLIADVRLNYRSDLPVFISRLSIDMTSAGLPPPQGGRGDGLGGLAEIRLGQASVVANDPLAFLIDTDNIDVSGDNTHFSTSGQIDLGQAFAESYFDNVVVPEPSTLAVAIALMLSLAVANSIAYCRQ